MSNTLGYFLTTKKNQIKLFGYTADSTGRQELSFGAAAEIRNLVSQELNLVPVLSFNSTTNNSKNFEVSELVPNETSNTSVGYMGKKLCHSYAVKISLRGQKLGNNSLFSSRHFSFKVILVTEKPQSSSLKNKKQTIL